MKTLFGTILLLLASTIMAQEFVGAQDPIISERIVTLPVDISTAKLKFTNLGYGRTYFVKIIVPALAGETIMNHRNLGEDGPCLFTYDTDNLEDVIQGNPEVVDTEFKIILKKNLFLDSDNICKVSLTEELSANVRGFQFIHSKTSLLPDRIAEDCF